MKKLSKYLKNTLLRKCIAACLYIVIGVLMIAVRGAAPAWTCRILGIGLCAIGIYNLVYHFVQNELIIGLPCDVMMIVAGILLVVLAEFIAAVVAILLGVFMIFKAVFGLQSALIDKKANLRSWIVDFVYAILTLIMGIMLIIPSTGLIDGFVIFLGIVLIVDGVMGLVALVQEEGCSSDYIFEMFEESDGTSRLFDFIPMLIDMHANDAVYLIDEVDRSLHPMLTLKLLEMYNSLLRSDSQMQLICTTHESSLLSTAPIRQDEVWFVEKDKNGESRCCSDSIVFPY